MNVNSVQMIVKGDFADSVAIWNRFLCLVNNINGLTVLATIKHDFIGGGVSGVVIIGESHAAVHTWPETDEALFELTSCGPESAASEFIVAMSSFGDVRYLRESPRVRIGQ